MSKLERYKCQALVARRMADLASAAADWEMVDGAHGPEIEALRTQLQIALSDLRALEEK